MATRAAVYWFSGTGNAWKLARAACAEIGRRAAAPAPVAAGGTACECRAIEQASGGGAVGEADLTGIVSPALGFGLPSNVASFLKRLPPGNGRKAFIAIALGNTETIALGARRMSISPSGGIALRQAARTLRRRGYDVAWAEAFEMPTNWILAIDPPPRPRADALVARGSEKIRSSMNALMRGERFHRPVSPLRAIPFAVVYALFSVIGRRYAGKLFYADDACDGCGECASRCPNGTIRWRSGRPAWGWSCLQCFRCINLCPRSAIQVSGLSIVAAAAPFLLMEYFRRRAIVPPLAHGLAAAGRIACCLIASAAIVELLHRLNSLPGAGRFIPRWPLTGKRARYAAPGFPPPEMDRSP